ncbi:MAG: hypothetical protein N2037_03725 [Acidimicrobiales bacterium]|nr:hypothetical protein [Acidimicrobiales bacterium]
MSERETGVSLEQHEIAWLHAKLQQEIAARGRAQAALEVAEARLRDLTVLSEVATAANTAGSLVTAAPTCLRLLARHIGARAGTLWICDGQCRRLDSSGYFYSEDPDFGDLLGVLDAVLHCGHLQIAERVLSSGHGLVVRVREAALDPPPPPDLEQAWVVVVPAICDGRVLAVVGLLVSKNVLLDAALVGLAERVVSQLAAVICRFGVSRQEAHEVRTPLHGLLGSLELLLEERLDGAARELAEAALACANALYQSIEPRLAVPDMPAQPGSTR